MARYHHSRSEHYIFHPHNAVPVPSFFTNPHEDVAPFFVGLTAVPDVHKISLGLGEGYWLTINFRSPIPTAWKVEYRLYLPVISRWFIAMGNHACYNVSDFGLNERGISDPIHMTMTKTSFTPITKPLFRFCFLYADRILRRDFLRFAIQVLQGLALCRTVSTCIY